MAVPAKLADECSSTEKAIVRTLSQMEKARAREQDVLMQGRTPARWGWKRLCLDGVTAVPRAGDKECKRGANLPRLTPPTIPRTRLDKAAGSGKGSLNRTENSDHAACYV